MNDLLTAYHAGATYAELQARFNISRETVRLRLRSAGIHNRPGPPRKRQAERLEEKGYPHFVAIKSCTAAAHACLKALGNGPLTITGVAEATNYARCTVADTLYALRRIGRITKYKRGRTTFWRLV
jgi:hypothetical protein